MILIKSSSYISKAIVIVASLALFISTTNPNNVVLPVLLMPFMGIALCIYFGSRYVLDQMLAFGGQRSKQTVAALVPTILVTMSILLKSIGQLTFEDVGIISILVLIVFFYLSRYR